MATDSPLLTVPDARAWHGWLTEHHGDPGGVWLVLAKRGTTEPTSLTYDQALEEALCFGWVDGQLGAGDEATFRRRFTPRRPGSSWSKRNVKLAELLASQGRMRPAGLAAVERAKADGTWGSAYSGQGAIEVPGDLAAALAAHPAAQEAFDNLSRANRYAVLYRIETAKRVETRNQRIERLVGMLARGETLHPQQRVPRRSPKRFAFRFWRVAQGPAAVPSGPGLAARPEYSAARSAQAPRAQSRRSERWAPRPRLSSRESPECDLEQSCWGEVRHYCAPGKCRYRVAWLVRRQGYGSWVRRGCRVATARPAPDPRA